SRAAVFRCRCGPFLLSFVLACRDPLPVVQRRNAGPRPGAETPGRWVPQGEPKSPLVEAGAETPVVVQGAKALCRGGAPKRSAMVQESAVSWSGIQRARRLFGGRSKCSHAGMVG